MPTNWQYIEDTLEEARDLAAKVRHLQEDFIEPERVKPYIRRVRCLVKIALADTDKALAAEGAGDDELS